MAIGYEPGSPEARQIAQQIYDEWIRAGADDPLARYMIGVAFHESNQFQLRSADFRHASGLYQTDDRMWHEMIRAAGGRTPNAALQTQIYIQNLKAYKNGSLWNAINASGGDPDKIFNAFHATGAEAGFSFDSRTRAPAAKWAEYFSPLIKSVPTAGQMARDYGAAPLSPWAPPAPADPYGFNATAPPDQAAPTSATPLADQFIQSLTSPVNPQQQMQQAVDFQYSSPFASGLTGNYLQAPQDLGPMFGAGVNAPAVNVSPVEAAFAAPEAAYQTDYHAALPGLGGAPPIEIGPSEASQFYGGTDQPQLLSDIATYDPSGAHAFSPYDPNFEYGNPGNIPEGLTYDRGALPGVTEPNYQMTGDFQPRPSYTPGGAGTHSGFDPYNWPTAEGMTPTPVDTYQAAPDYGDYVTNYPDYTSYQEQPTEPTDYVRDTGSAYQPADEAISGVSVPASEQAATDYGNEFIATGEPTIMAGDTSREGARAGDEGALLAGVGAESRIGGEGPFAGFTPSEMEQWHSGESAITGHDYPTYEGMTANGEPLAYQTTITDVPGYGEVPHAQLYNPQASTFSDFISPFSGNTGADLSTTQKVGGVIGSGVGAGIGSLIPIPFVGTWGGGKLGGMFGRWLGGLGGPNVRQAGIGGLPPMPTGSVSLPMHGGYAPSAFSPTGQTGRVSQATGQGREWWSPDFGRGLPSGQAGMGPGDWRGWNETPSYDPASQSWTTTGGAPGSYGIGGWGGSYFGNTVGNFGTAIGFGGNLGGGGSINAGQFLAPHLGVQLMKGIWPNPSMGYGNYWSDHAQAIANYAQQVGGAAYAPGPAINMGGMSPQQYWTNVFQNRGFVYWPQQGGMGGGQPVVTHSTHTQVS